MTFSPQRSPCSSAAGSPYPASSRHAAWSAGPCWRSRSIRRCVEPVPLPGEHGGFVLEERLDLGLEPFEAPRWAAERLELRRSLQPVDLDPRARVCRLSPAGQIGHAHQRRAHRRAREKPSTLGLDRHHRRRPARVRLRQSACETRFRGRGGRERLQIEIAVVRSEPQHAREFPHAKLLDLEDARSRMAAKLGSGPRRHTIAPAGDGPLASVERGPARPALGEPGLEETALRGRRQERGVEARPAEPCGVGRIGAASVVALGFVNLPADPARIGGPIPQTAQHRDLEAEALAHGLVQRGDVGGPALLGLDAGEPPAVRPAQEQHLGTIRAGAGAGDDQVVLGAGRDRSHAATRHRERQGARWSHRNVRLIRSPSTSGCRGTPCR